MKQRKRRNVLLGGILLGIRKNGGWRHSQSFLRAQKGRNREENQAIFARASWRREDFVRDDGNFCGVLFVAGDYGVGFERAGSGSGARSANACAGGNHASASGLVN
ncbi:MAG: hypothetical protein ABR860_03270 [Terracidiphilus sp.]